MDFIKKKKYYFSFISSTALPLSFPGWHLEYLVFHLRQRYAGIQPHNTPIVRAVVS